jgi:hypothetical protein
MRKHAAELVALSPDVILGSGGTVVPSLLEATRSIPIVFTLTPDPVGGGMWWGSNGFDTVTFNSFGVPTGRNGGTTLEGGGGIAGKLTQTISVYGDASYLTSVSGESHIALKGNVGLRVTW